MDMPLFLGIVLSLVSAIFFSGVEVAFLSANKLKIELLSKQRNPAGLIMGFFSERPTWLIGTTLVGNLISIVFFGIFSTQALLTSVAEKRIGLVLGSVVLFSLLLTVIVLYSVEYLSKTVFVINSNRIMAVLAFPFVLISAVMFPLVYIVISLAKFVSVSLFRLEYSMDKPVFGLTDVNQYLKTIQRVKPAEQNIELEKKIYTNALEFKSVRVRDCMIPRTEIVSVAIDGGIDKLHQTFIESGHSKILVYRDSPDDVIGYCHSAALFRRPSRVEEILTPIISIPESTLAKDLLVKFINERKSLAIVIDEFGGTSGIVSMEDVIEEIFGEIEDEHDQDDLIEQQLDESTWLLSARLEVRYLNERYGWNLPEGDYDTLSGLILSYTEDIPKQGDAIKIPPFTFTIHSKAANRINTIRVARDLKNVNT